MLKRCTIIVSLIMVSVLCVPTFACASIVNQEDLQSYEFFRTFNIDIDQYFEFVSEDNSEQEERPITREDIFCKDTQAEYGNTSEIKSQSTLDPDNANNLESVDLDNKYEDITQEEYLVIEPDNVPDVSEPLPKDINDFNYLYLTKGFEKEVTPTFASMMNISGEGVKGTSVGVLIYTKDSSCYHVNFESIKNIGASGLYSEVLEFDFIGSNYVIVVVKKDNSLLHRQYTINRKEETTKDKLENIDLDFNNNESENDDYDLLEEIFEEQGFLYEVTEWAIK